MEKLYLSQRDITNLLAKLDSVRDGGVSTCTLIKNDVTHPVYRPTLRRIAVVAAEEQDRYMPGVSPRLQLSRATLDLFLELMAAQSGGALRIDDLEVFAVPDEKYHVDRDDANGAAVGDLASAFIRSRGKPA